eukprot:8600247-Lingulodinium_polyedra.AAC.1
MAMTDYGLRRFTDSCADYGLRRITARVTDYRTNYGLRGLRIAMPCHGMACHVIQRYGSWCVGVLVFVHAHGFDPAAFVRSS